MRLLAGWLKLALINLAVCVALLIALELVFGGWLRRDGDVALLDRQPNTSDIEASPLYPSGVMITYSRDRYGFRGGTGAAAGIDVLAIGGSPTNERYVDDADLWTARLQKLLRAEGCQLTIANAGVDGYSTFGNILSFDNWFNHIPGLKPRFVVVYAGNNDAMLDPTAIAGPKPTGWWRRVEQYVAANSAARQVYVALRGWWRRRQAPILHGEVAVGPTAVWEPAELPADFDRQAAVRAAAFRQRLERLDRLIRDFGARPIYVTEPRVDGRRVESKWWQVAGSQGAYATAMVGVIDRTTLDFCRDSGEACIDLAGELRFQPGDHYDGLHTTPAGSVRIAEFLAGRLRPLVCRATG